MDGIPLLVRGAIIDATGTRTGYVRIRGGRVTDTGALGTESLHGKDRPVTGIVLPRSVNGHTHLGDSSYGREPPHGPLSRLVRPPDGLKFRILRDTPPNEKRRAMRAALIRMGREGVGAVIDFREEGVEGVELLREAATDLPLAVLALGRPLARPLNDAELDAVLRVADGVGLSSSLEEDYETRSRIAAACRRRRSLFALHASEAVREPPDNYLRPRPDLLVHLTRATPGDVEAVASERVPVAVCPRSNALFGRRPDLALFHKTGVRLLLGTDNGMFHSPSLLRELEFAYVTARLVHRPVPPEFLVRAAFVEPWSVVGNPDQARIEVGSRSPIIFRLPIEDPAYQIVARATAHLIIRPSEPASRARGR